MSAADEQPESTATPTRSEDSAEGGDLGHETSRAEVGHVLEFLEDGNARQAQTAWNEAKKKLLKTDDLGGMRVLLAELSAAQVPEKTRRLHGELLYSTQQNVRFLERKAGIQPSAPLVLAARAASTPMRATTVSHELDDKEELAFKVDSLARALAERRKRLEAATRQFEAARKAHSQRVSAARKARDATRMGRKLAGGSIWSSGQLSKVALYEGTIVTPDGTHALTSDVRATVDTAGNLMVTRRHTLTRAALLGPFSLFAPKSVTHGENEVYLLIESDNFASVVQCRPEQTSLHQSEQDRLEKLRTILLLAASDMNQAAAAARALETEARASRYSSAGNRDCRLLHAMIRSGSSSGCSGRRSTKQSGWRFSRAASGTVLAGILRGFDSRRRHYPLQIESCGLSAQPDQMLDDESRYAEKARKRAFSRASSGLAGAVTPRPSSHRR